MPVKLFADFNCCTAQYRRRLSLQVQSIIRSEIMVSAQKRTFMEASPSGTEKPIVHPPIIALALTFFGLALIEAWLASLHARPSSHVLAAIPGLLLVSLSIRRSPTFRIWFFHKGSDAARYGRFDACDAGTALLLSATGSLLGVLVLSGMVVPLVIVAMGIQFIPWWRLRLCRDHFFGASTLLWLTGCLVIAAGYRTIDFMTLPIAGWALWTCACFSLLQSISQLWRAERTALAIEA